MINLDFFNDPMSGIICSESFPLEEEKEFHIVRKLSDAIEPQQDIIKELENLESLFESKYIVKTEMQMLTGEIIKGKTVPPICVFFKKAEYLNFASKFLNNLKEYFKEKSLDEILTFSINFSKLRLYRYLFVSFESTQYQFLYRITKIKEKIIKERSIKYLYFDVQELKYQINYLYEFIIELLEKEIILLEPILYVIYQHHDFLAYALLRLPPGIIRFQLQCLQLQPSTYPLEHKIAIIKDIKDSLLLETRLQGTKDQWVIFNNSLDFETSYPGLSLYNKAIGYNLFWKKIASEEEKEEGNIKNLIKKSTDHVINCGYGKNNSTILMQACYRGYKKLVSILLEQKTIDIMSKDHSNKSALDYALEGRAINEHEVYDIIIKSINEFYEKNNLQLSPCFSISSDFQEFKSYFLKSPDFIEKVRIMDLTNNSKTLITYLKKISAESKSDFFWGKHTLLSIFVNFSLRLSSAMNKDVFKIEGPVISIDILCAINNLISLGEISYLKGQEMETNPWLEECRQLLNADNVNQLDENKETYLIQAISKGNINLAIICILAGADIYIKNVNNQNILELFPMQEFKPNSKKSLSLFFGLLIERGWYIFQYVNQYDFCNWQEETIPQKLYIWKNEDLLEYKLINPKGLLVRGSIPMEALINENEIFLPAKYSPKILNITAKKGHTKPLLFIENEVSILTDSKLNNLEKAFIEINAKMLLCFSGPNEKICFDSYFLNIPEKIKKEIGDLKKKIEKKNPSSEINFHEVVVCPRRRELPGQIKKILYNLSKEQGAFFGSNNMTLIMQAAFVGDKEIFEELLKHCSIEFFNKNIFSLAIKGSEYSSDAFRHSEIIIRLHSLNIEKQSKKLDSVKTHIRNEENSFENRTNSLLSSLFSLFVTINQLEEYLKNIQKLLKNPEKFEHKKIDFKKLKEEVYIDQKSLFNIKSDLNIFHMEILKDEKDNFENLLEKFTNLKNSLSTFNKYENTEDILKKSSERYEKKQRDILLSEEENNKNKSKPVLKIKNKKKKAKRKSEKPIALIDHSSEPVAPLKKQEEKVCLVSNSFFLQKISPKPVVLGDFLKKNPIKNIEDLFSNILNTLIDEKDSNQQMLKREAILWACATFSHLIAESILEKFNRKDLGEINYDFYQSCYIALCLKHIRNIIFHNFHQLTLAEPIVFSYSEVLAMGMQWEKILFFSVTNSFSPGAWQALQDNSLFKKLMCISVINHSDAKTISLAKDYFNSQIKQEAPVLKNLAFLHEYAIKLYTACRGFYSRSQSEKDKAKQLRHPNLYSFMGVSRSASSNSSSLTARVSN